jgi:hypothetical protein
MVGLVRGVRFDLDSSGPSAYLQSLSPSPWWQEPADLLARFSDQQAKPCSADWYRLVDRFLGIDSEDRTLRQRFRTLYSEFLAPFPSPPEAAEGVLCRIQVQEGAPAHLVTFTAHSAISIVDFILALFPGRGYVELNQAADGWRSLGVVGQPFPFLTARGSQVLVEAREAWQPLIANCALNWVMQMQSELLFFHAAAVAVRGQGVLLAGEKGAGKSTLSLALAAQDHEFFGDEIAAVRVGKFELTPFRRAVSVRGGPQAPRVQEKLRSKSCVTETFPDGTVRSRALASEFFPAAGASPRPLRWVFFLRGFEPRPRAESFHPRLENLRLLAPLACTLWERSFAGRMTEVAKMLSSVNCYFLYLGLPEDTAEVVERIVRSK